MSAQATNTSDARREMIDVQIAGRGIRDKRVLEARRVVPREAFVAEGFEEFAYDRFQDSFSPTPRSLKSC
jgi:protein-L-isoaspartate O-methyltransferase